MGDIFEVSQWEAEKDVPGGFRYNGTMGEVLHWHIVPDPADTRIAAGWAVVSYIHVPRADDDDSIPYYGVEVVEIWRLRRKGVDPKMHKLFLGNLPNRIDWPRFERPAQ